MLFVRQAIKSVVVGSMLARERWQSGVVYNPLSAATAQDPYPVYAALRERGPVHHSRLMNAWLFSRHADIDTILRDHRRFANDPRKGRLSRRQRANLPAEEEFTMLFLDPPDHKRLRALVNKAFTPKAVNALEPHIRSLLGSLLDDIDDPSGFDLMQAVAQPLPVIVIAEMLGVPPEDRAQFKIWSDQRARILEPLIDAREREVADAAPQQGARRLLPDRSSEERRAAPQGRHRERARAGGGGRRPPDRARDAEHAAPAAHRRQRDHHQPHRQRLSGPAATTPISSSGSGTIRA